MIRTTTPAYSQNWPFLKTLQITDGLFSFALSSVFIVFFCLLFNPVWHTNDDVFMSMIAHGYGAAAYGSPHLVYSNVIWGYAVRALPTINGTLGYSLGTLTILFAIGWTTLYFLLRLGTGRLIGTLALILLFSRPLLFPQFTINAGLLTVAAILGCKVYERSHSKFILLATCLLAFWGYLIRSQEFFLVMVVALPFLPWHTLKTHRNAQVALLLLVSAILAAAVFDRWSYTGEEWTEWKEFFSSVVQPFGNFGAGAHLKQYPNLLQRYGYSNNDIDLISPVYFFVDPVLANPKILLSMLNESGYQLLRINNWPLGIFAIKVLLDPILLPLLLAGFFSFLLAPRWSVALTWILCITALFIMGLIGRPGVLRVYIPLVTLLFVIPLTFSPLKSTPQRWIITLILIIACILNTVPLIRQALASQKHAACIKKDLKNFPTNTILSGGYFPYEYAFPLFQNDPSLREVPLYGLHSFTLAPFSIHIAARKTKTDLIKKLQTKKGINILSTEPLTHLLAYYCQERLKGKFSKKVIYQNTWGTVRTIHCETQKEEPHQ